MSNRSGGEWIGFFLLGIAIAAVTTLLLTPESGARTRRRIRSEGKDAADYLVGAGKDLVETCEELYERSGELAGKGAHELSEKFRDLADRSKQVVDQAGQVIRRAAVNRSR